MADERNEQDQRDELTDAQMDGVSGGGWNPFKKESWDQLGTQIQQAVDLGIVRTQTAANHFNTVSGQVVGSASDQINQAGLTFSGGGRPGRPR